MIWRLCVMFLLSTAAEAASRVVISTPEPLQVFVDGMMVPTSIGTIRTSIPQVTEGEHTFAVHSLTGVRLHAERVLIPDGADVRIQYIPGAAFTISGAEQAPGGPPPSSLPASQVSNAPGVVPQGVGSASPSATSARPAGPTAGDVLEGSAVSTSRASSLQRVMASPTPTNILTNSARGLRSMTAGARAGTNFGDAPPAAQAIKRANVVYGTAVFKKAGGGPIVIYEDGHMITQLGPGPAERSVQLEVGRRELEIRSGVDYQVLFTGDLQVDQLHVEELNVSDTAAPTASVRPWLWSNH